MQRQTLELEVLHFLSCFKLLIHLLGFHISLTVLEHRIADELSIIDTSGDLEREVQEVIEHLSQMIQDDELHAVVLVFGTTFIMAECRAELGIIEARDVNTLIKSLCGKDKNSQFYADAQENLHDILGKSGQ